MRFLVACLLALILARLNRNKEIERIYYMTKYREKNYIILQTG